MDNNFQNQVWGQPASPQQPPVQPQPQPAQPVYGAPVNPTIPVYAQAPAAPQAKKSHGWIIALVCIVAVFLLCAIGMWSCTSIASSSVNMLSPFASMSSSMYTSDIDYLTDDTIAVINIDGTIGYDGSTSSPEGLKEQLDIASDNPHIKAVVLRVNSGGGEATAGEEMSTYVRDFDKPVVVSSASLNASAAYEISSQSDYIFTAKTTSIGAIGTAMQITDMSGLMDKLGIDVDTITSSESKDSSYGYRPLTDEEREYYQSMVDQINATFIEAVAEGRDMSIEEVQNLANGMTFTGMEAVENGLADEIGTREDALDKAAELAGISRYSVIELAPYDTDLSSLLGML
ncbi:signal peptide peptidase SppA [Eggerthellaceae bacterium 3-80]